MSAPSRPQYVFVNAAPGTRWHQNAPESIGDTLFREPLDALALASNDGPLRLGLAFILSYFDGPLPVLEASLRRLLVLSERWDTPVLITLDGENWWGGRPDLWNFWDPKSLGYDPSNRENVEWTGPSPETAVQLCWRNWGRQIRVLPQPNLAAKRVRDAHKEPLTRLVKILGEWSAHLPMAKQHLFPGVKVGWEASVGINFYHYPCGNRLLNTNAANDPQTGLDMRIDFAGGVAPLGYAALAAMGTPARGAITLADQERITADYLAFLSRLCRSAGFGREQIFTHAGGQFAPWDKHYSHRVAINRDATPGWSLYGHAPEDAGDLAESLARAKRDSWCAAEWLPNARTADEWADALHRTLRFRKCRFVDIYNWEGIRSKPEALAGIRLALKGG